MKAKIQFMGGAAGADLVPGRREAAALGWRLARTPRTTRTPRTVLGRCFALAACHVLGVLGVLEVLAAR